MKVFGFISKPFNPNFMTYYATAFNGVVYMPSIFNIDDETTFNGWETLIEHEKVHLNDMKKYSILFYLMYLTPYGRYVLERKAFLPELLLLVDQHQYTWFEMRLDMICSMLSGPNYFWCWPKKWIKQWFLKQTKMS